MHGGKKPGALPGEFLLLTTCPDLAAVRGHIYGKQKEQINQWCLICGLLYSMGAL